MGLLSFLTGSKSQQTDAIEILSVADFKSGIAEKNIQLIDVRTPREYRSEHISKAVNIDIFQKSSFRASVEKLDKNKPVYLYCRSGNRSQKAARVLADMGFNQIFDLKGGYMAWS